jgi:hypothetical protein
LTLTSAEYDRLQNLADGDDPGTVLRDALESELRMRETVRTVQRRLEGEESVGLPDIGPLHDSPVGSLLGFEVVELGDGEATLSMEATSRHANRGGPVQGGIITALADTTPRSRS